MKVHHLVEELLGKDTSYLSERTIDAKGEDD
jgi:hypothetical protein